MLLEQTKLKVNRNLLSNVFSDANKNPCTSNTSVKLWKKTVLMLTYSPPIKVNGTLFKDLLTSSKPV